MRGSPSWLVDGPATAPIRLLFAHGAGAPMDSPFMGAFACALAARGWQVLRFEFPYMERQRQSGKRCAPDRLPKLLESYREQVHQAGQGAPLLIGGKSMGGRVASLLVDELAEAGAVVGCICLGYPFHPPGQPLNLRTSHLSTLSTPTLIVQGERDPFGHRDEVESYTLSPQIEVEWMPAGDHSFKPTVSSGVSTQQNLERASTAIDQFGKTLVRRRP